MKKKIIVVICIAVIAVSAAVFIFGYNVENEQEHTEEVTTNNATKGKEINVFLSDGVGVSDNP